MLSISDFLNTASVFLSDGAMGTELLRRGYAPDAPFEFANLTHPELVQEIHQDYLQAGAHFLETNTFGANALKLSAFGLEEKVKEIVRQGILLAREVASQKAYILGSVGPLGKPIGQGLSISNDQAKEIYREQLEAILEGGVDAILFETMASTHEVTIAVEVLHSFGTNIPYIVQFSFLSDGITPYGESISKVVNFLQNLDALVVGINCGSGPHEAQRFLEYFSTHLPGPFSIQPNAGYPQTIQGRMVYGAPPDYFASFVDVFITLRAKILGGCCGTTPEHIHALQKKIGSLPKNYSIEVLEVEEQKISSKEIPPSKFAQKLGKQFVFTVEINPPKSPSLEKTKKGISFLKKVKVDAVNISDSPMARVRISPIALAHLLKEELGLEAIVHFTCRDRNLISLQSELLGASALGIQNILALTGDPTSLGDHPRARPVFDVTSEGLVLILNRLNSGMDFMGNPLEEKTNFTIGVALNLSAGDLSQEMERFKRKLEKGVHFILTQPIYDPKELEKFLETFRDPLPPLLGGILPLRSFRHAEFLHHEVPGITIPEELRTRMAQAQNPQEEGITIACEIARKIRNMVAGIYIMPPFEKYEMALSIIEFLRREEN
ncbi:MAG: bifunctional homocysteine S-methyltransferase/methylenetetrahydrofolate reductase [Candidatus Caldatribacteriaceae bacterium]